MREIRDPRAVPSADYYRKQAQLFASMALAGRDPTVISRYNELALDYLARADEIEPVCSCTRPAVSRHDGSDRDRD